MTVTQAASHFGIAAPLCKRDRKSGAKKRKQEDIERAYHEVLKSRLHIDHCPGTSIQELRVKARYDVQRYDLKLICIDYAQLVTSSSKSAQGNRTQEMVTKSLEKIRATRIVIAHRLSTVMNAVADATRSA